MTETYNTTPANFTNYCRYRLPCGYCEKLEKTCTMPYYTTRPYYAPCEPTWGVPPVTCDAEYAE